MSKDDQETPEDMEEKAKMAERIVKTTLAFFSTAKLIIEEQRKADGDEFNPVNEPSLQELVCVSQLIMNGSMTGAYQDPKQTRKGGLGGNPDSIVRAVLDGITPVIDSKIRLALMKVGPQPMTRAVPMPAPTPLPSIYERAIDEMYGDLKDCGCLAKSPDCTYCRTCVKLTTTVETITEYMGKAK